MQTSGKIIRKKDLETEVVRSIYVKKQLPENDKRQQARDLPSFEAQLPGNKYYIMQSIRILPLFTETIIL